MGFLDIYSSLSRDGKMFSIAFPPNQGVIYTNTQIQINNPQQEVQSSSAQEILSDYTLIAKSGNDNFYALIKKNGAESEYIINTGSSSNTNMIVRYDPSDNNPSFLYYDYINPYNYLRYLKFNNETWSGVLVDNIGPGAYEESIDLKYDPNDNLPACIAFDNGNSQFNYYKYNGSSFVKTTILNAGITNIQYASLNFDPADNYPAIIYRENTTSSIKYAKYNGASWTTTTVNTFGSSNDKRYIVTEFAESINQPIVLMAGNTSGVFLNVKDSNNIWKSGKFLSNEDVIYQKPGLKISESDSNDVYISYVNNQNELIFITKDQLINADWNSNLDAYSPIKLKLVSGNQNININKSSFLQIDSDSQPVVFYKKDDSIKYIKNTGSITTNINATSFSGVVNLKNINNSENQDYGIEFLKEKIKVYQSDGISFRQYIAPYESASVVQIDSAVINYSTDIKINPITNQPNIVALHSSPPNIKYYYPNNPQKTSWTKLSLPSGNLLFSGTNISATLTANYNCNFDFDKITNQPVILVFGYNQSNQSSGTCFLVKKDLEGSGYIYYNTPYTGYAFAASDFKVNPVNNKYCLAVANEDTNFKGETGLRYYEMDPSTNSWTKYFIDPLVAQNSKIYLDFKSNGFPIISYKGKNETSTSGYLKIAEYDGIDWTTTTLVSGSS